MAISQYLSLHYRGEDNIHPIGWLCLHRIHGCCWFTDTLLAASRHLDKQITRHIANLSVLLNGICLNLLCSGGGCCDLHLTHDHWYKVMLEACPLLNEDNLRLFVKLLGYPDTYSLHLASIQYFKKIFSFMLLEYLHCSNPAQIGQIVEQKKRAMNLVVLYVFGNRHV
jgi:hypothetical protein